MTPAQPFVSRRVCWGLIAISGVGMLLALAGIAPLGKTLSIVVYGGLILAATSFLKMTRPKLRLYPVDKPLSEKELAWLREEIERMQCKPGAIICYLLLGGGMAWFSYYCYQTSSPDGWIAQGVIGVLLLGEAVRDMAQCHRNKQLKRLINDFDDQQNL